MGGRVTSRVPLESRESFVRRRRDCPTRACRSLAASGAPDFRGLRRRDLKYSAWKSTCAPWLNQVYIPGRGVYISSSRSIGSQGRLWISFSLFMVCWCLPGELTIGVPVATHLLSACSAAKACIAVHQLLPAVVSELTLSPGVLQDVPFIRYHPLPLHTTKRSSRGLHLLSL
jgi:hypothetical protein